ncbi:MAG: hypothetical protein R3B93_18795 [Bacteroidia bacterium]
MIKGAKGENIEEPDDIDKEIALLEQRLKTVSQKVERTKSRESILDIFDNSIAKLFSQYLHKAKLFEKFYINSRFWMGKNNISGVSDKENALKENRRLVNDSVNSIKILIDYQAFNQAGFQEFNHISEIIFLFYSTIYRVENTAGISIEKLYGEQLNEAEITHLVNSEIKKHKDLIDAKIEELKKKN